MIGKTHRKVSEAKGTQGAWIIHHDQKLAAVRSPDFQSIALAGRATRLLSVISKEDDWTVSNERVAELARSSGIAKYAIPGLLDELSTAGLIDKSAAGVAVLGVTQANLLGNASDLFDAQTPEGLEKAAIDLAERASRAPIRRDDCEEEIADVYKLPKADLDDLFQLSEQIGFIDFEQSRSDKLYFNGALFKREQAAKAKQILDGLDAKEAASLANATTLLDQKGCIPAETLKAMLGAVLWSKLHQIGFFEVSVVTNEFGPTEFVMKPSALAKFVPGGLADMLDDAKALASSLTYGILKSSKSRGSIRDPDVLLNVFVNRGYVEGWAGALKEDYKLLERRGVVTVTTSNAGHRLTLNKPEIGEMAKELILKGDAAQSAAQFVAGSTAAQYVGPEGSRRAERLKDIPEAKTGAAKALNILRKAR